MGIQTVCGSPMYMAPEIMKKKKYDFKSDLWSVGIIFYEMLVGRTPFKAKNIFDLMRQIEKQDIKYPMISICSEQCEDLLFKLLKKIQMRELLGMIFLNIPGLNRSLRREKIC